MFAFQCLPRSFSIIFNHTCTFSLNYLLFNGLGAAEHRAIDSSSFIDYNNSVWTPIGPGDPLNKDPTYDYSPPVLDRVRYWAETTATGSSMAAKPAAIPYSSYQHNNPHSNVVHKTKSDILLLGVPAMKRAQFKHVDAVETYAQPGQGQAPPRRNFYAQVCKLNENRFID